MTLLAPNAVAQNELDMWSKTRACQPISAGTVGRWLNAEHPRPQRYHAWRRLHDLVAYILKRGISD